MNDYEYAIEISGLTKKYDGFTLDNVSFNVPKGSIMGFIGQNGAGKCRKTCSFQNCYEYYLHNCTLNNLNSSYIYHYLLSRHYGYR